MSNSRLTAKPLAAAISAGHQVVAHKSTGGTLTSIPEPVDPVGNASHRLTNNTVALPGQRLSIFSILAAWKMKKLSIGVGDGSGKQRKSTVS